MTTTKRFEFFKMTSVARLMKYFIYKAPKTTKDNKSNKNMHDQKGIKKFPNDTSTFEWTKLKSHKTKVKPVNIRI